MWFRYSNNLSLPKNFRLRMEVENRFFIKPVVKEHQFLVRVQVKKQFKKDWYLGLGLVFFDNGVSNTDNPSSLLVPEWRPYLEAGTRQKITDWFSISHRYRVEWRFQHNTHAGYTELENGFRNNFRFRYQFGLEFIALKHDKSDLRIRLADECMINAGTKRCPEYF